MFPLLPLLFVDVTTILLIVEPDGTDVLLIVKEPRAEVATVSFVRACGRKVGLCNA